MQIIHLNANSFAMFPRVAMVQNDTGRELKMVLDDMTLSGSETGAVAIHRSDGSYYTIPATRVVGDNAFTADMSQALTQPRQTECQLKVTASDDTVISTYTFMIYVQPSVDGISEEQLGYSVQEVVQAAQDIMEGGMPLDLRMALLQIASKVAYIDDQGAQYYQDLYDALAPSAILTGITAVYTQSGTVFSTDALDSLKADLVVTALYSDGTTQTLLASEYTLSGTLTGGTSSVTVEYEGKTTTFDVTVTAATDVTPALTSFEATNPANVGVTPNTTDGTIRVYTQTGVSRTYQGVRASFTTEAGYAYKVDFDYAVTKGKAKTGLTNTNGTLITYSDTKTGSGHISFVATHDAAIAYFFLYCTWSTTEAGDVTYSNLKVIKYAE